MEEPTPRGREADEERRRRERREQEELERILLAHGETEDDRALPADRTEGDVFDAGALPEHDVGGLDERPFDDGVPLAADGDGRDRHDPLLVQEAQRPRVSPSSFANRVSYVQASFGAALGLLYYALRSRQQWYLAMIYLSSSKFTYIVWGNALVAACVYVFFAFCNVFLNGLRVPEAEGLGDFFRWNITETCLALTMFRSSLDVKTGCYFVALVCLKCLHWVVQQREGHLRMTEDAVVVHPQTGWPAVRTPFLRLLSAILVLQIADIWAVTKFVQSVIANGPTVSILFAFETAILLVSAFSNVLLWNLHLLDGIVHFVHEHTSPASAFHHFIHPWKDHRATLVFAVEVQAQAAKFVFYVTFFSIVWTYSALPVNLIREVYMSFRALQQRLSAFGKYRKLMKSMRSFDNPTDEELDEAGRTCIICRDEMSVPTSKRLPGCNHIFHKSCLREWLVQQQSCPTCRSDIQAMQARQRQQETLDRARAEENAAQDDIDTAADNEGPEHPRSSHESESAMHTGEEDTEGKNSNDSDSDEPELTVHEAAEQQAQRMRDAALAMAAEEQSRQDQAKATKKEKHVRFSFGTEDKNILQQREEPVFPAFYKVVRDDGADVWNDGDTMSFVIRQVPFGVIILGQELKWREVGEGPERSQQMMVRMPDGWVKDTDVQRIVAVPLSA